ncbi:helix-turn-helix domain-containing protein [Flagellimonas sp.]|uniref:helix-turn-helix domain-containing protein n=1 Tax=Flagellimonas sp. TaxID=2058762 RepID=UPI003B5CC64D
MLFSLPAKRTEKNKSLILLLNALLIHLLAEQLLIKSLISVYTFSIITVSMVIIYGPSLYSYTMNLYGLKTKGVGYHIFFYELILLFIWYMNLNTDYIFPQWAYSLYYTSILIVYFLFSLSVIKNNKKEFDKNNSWSVCLGVGFGVLVLLQIMESLWINFNRVSAVETAYLFTMLQNVSCCLFMLMTIKQIVTNPQLFSGVQIRILNSSKAGINIQELNLILEFVKTKKAYKDPKLNRHIISNATGLNTNLISKIINSAFGKNLNVWINDFRIEEAKIFLKETSLSIKEIYFEVGFNSKSAFNNSFKKKEGQTPSEYRLRHS